MALDYTLKRKTTEGEETLHPTTNWGQIENKPSTFTPTGHEHDIIDDVKASAHKLFYSDSNGNIQQLNLGNEGQVLKSAGSLNSPYWGADGDANNYPSSLSFASSTGSLTLGRTGLSNLTTSIDGRYLQLSGGTLTGTLTGTSIDLNSNIKIGNSNTLSNEGFELDGTSSIGLRATNSEGYISLTPLNSGWAHIYTDRPNFIFNKDVYTTSNAFSSYNNNLLLKRSGSTKLTLTSTQATFENDIKTNGKLGIGVNPTSPLHIEIASDSGEMPEGMLTLENTTTSGESAIRYINDATSSTGNYWYSGLNNANTFNIAYGTANTNSNTKMSISTDGTVTAPTFSGALSGNATSSSKLATTRSIALNGAVSGSTNFDGSGDVVITTTATSDPKLTIDGDASGNATFTNLGDTTLTLTVNDDSHNHTIANVDGLQTTLDGKLSSTGKAVDSDKLDNLDSSQFLRSDTDDTASGSLRFLNSNNYFGGTATNTAEIWMQTGNAGSPQIGLTDNQSDMS